MTGTQRDAVSYGTVALASCVLLLRIIPTWTPAYPGYGVPASVLPSTAAGIMLGLSVLGLVRTGMRRNRTSAERATRICWGHAIMFFVPCALLMPVMSLVGFMPAGIAFMALLQHACGQRSRRTVFIVSLASVVAVYVFMRHGLGIPLP
jgi:hypothetical protein